MRQASENIEQFLSNPKEIFIDNKQTPTKIYLSYSNDRLDSINNAIKRINSYFTTHNEVNSIIIDKNFRADQDLHIHLKFGQNTPIYLETVKCNENIYNQLLSYKEEDVNLSAFFYFIKITKDTPNQSTSNDRELLELLGIDANEDYDCKKINFKGMFTLKSDDDCKNPATFIP